MKNAIRSLLLGAAASAAVLVSGDARGDSVAQVATAKRISRQTVALIDPQGRPVPGGGVNTLAKVGDVLTFIIQFTPVPNGAFRGLGGYITDYIPPNTEVVGARIVDRNGNTVSPHRGGLSCDGYGPRGKGTWTGTGTGAASLVQGSMSQLYADTGIFYSTDARTKRVSKNAANVDEAFLSLQNGIQMPVAPSGAGQLAGLLNTASPYYAHNLWDLASVARWGPANGNGPEQIGSAGIGYASPVAGPDSWYKLEVTVTPPGTAVTAANLNTVVQYNGNVGPWSRVRQTGSEIGRRGQGDSPPSAAQNTNTYLQCPGSAPTRVGIPTSAGFNLTTSNPLPATTNAVRFALGELVVGDEYFAEISLRVVALPLDPTFGNINCAEVAGGDASSRTQDGGTGGKDYLWRYFLPAPACVSLDLLFENTVDKVLAAANAPLTYTIEAKNLTTTPMTSVVVRDCYVPGDETFNAAGTTPGFTLDAAGAGCPNPAAEDAIVWTVGTLAPGESKSYTATFVGKASTSNRAVFTSNAFPAPGFVATAWTTVGSTALMRLGVTAAPTYVPALPGTVHYVATVKNDGTTAASTISETVTLPAATWMYKAGTTKVNGVATALNPTQTGAAVVFKPALLPASIAAGGTATFEFDVTVPVGTAAGLYTVDLTSWVTAGQDLEDSISKVAPVAVLTARSDTPTVTSPILQGAVAVKGKSTEAAGSTVTIYVNGNVAGTGTVGAAGAYSVTVPPLVAGQRVEVSVTAAGELESTRSLPEAVVGVSGTAACSDGKDNDGDGKIDYPADPGCTSAADTDETDVPQCSDGLDNDGDGLIDYPNDPGCASYLDATEGGNPACSDGLDNDGDGKVDFPADPGCSSANDTSESDIAACSDGLDNDGDGKTDFPFDPGCTSALDDNELDTPGADGGIADGGSDSGVDAGGTNPNGRPPGAEPPDLGGVPDDEATSGCSCGVAPTGGSAHAMLAAALVGVLLIRRRRR